MSKVVGPMPDWRITELARAGMISPYIDEQVVWIKGDIPALSYGVSSYGYDMRLSNEFKIFTNLYSGVIDPKEIDQLQVHEVCVDDFVIIPPNAFALCRSVEYFRIPRDVVGIVLGKSTYARCGLVANITALEPEWEGHLTIELSNTAPLPLKVYAFEGIAQAIFFEGSDPCMVSYKDKRGKYQGQRGITLPKV